MIQLTKKNALALAFSMVVMAGCSSTDTQEGAGDVTPVDQSAGGETYGADSGAAVNAAELAEQQAAAMRKITTFYFDFDKSEIKPEARDALLAHATYLAANGSANVRLEGHADERGTKEYNIALGDRRAQAVERFLVVNGVGRGQIETVSYGEERPAAVGHEEGSWSQNRRVEVIYK